MRLSSACAAALAVIVLSSCGGGGGSGSSSGSASTPLLPFQGGTAARGEVSGTGDSAMPGVPLSADGRYALERCSALPPAIPANGVYLWDRQSGTRQLLHAYPDVFPYECTDAISANGEWLLYHHGIVGATNVGELYRRRRGSSTEEAIIADDGSPTYTSRVSWLADDGNSFVMEGAWEGGGTVKVGILKVNLVTRAAESLVSWSHVIELGTNRSSADGNKVCFSSSSATAVAGDTNGVTDIFYRDLASPSLQRISVKGASTQANGASKSPSMTADGKWVLFLSQASNLVDGDTATQDMFLRDIDGATTQRLGLTAWGFTSEPAVTLAEISPNGRYILFLTTARLTGETITGAALYLRDRSTGTTRRVSYPEASAIGSAELLAFSPGSEWFSFIGRTTAGVSFNDSVVAAITPGGNG